MGSAAALGGGGEPARRPRGAARTCAGSRWRSAARSASSHGPVGTTCGDVGVRDPRSRTGRSATVCVPCMTASCSGVGDEPGRLGHGHEREDQAPAVARAPPSRSRSSRPQPVVQSTAPSKRQPPAGAGRGDGGRAGAAQVREGDAGGRAAGRRGRAASRCLQVRVPPAAGCPAAWRAASTTNQVEPHAPASSSATSRATAGGCPRPPTPRRGDAEESRGGERVEVAARDAVGVDLLGVGPQQVVGERAGRGDRVGGRRH